MQSRAAGPLMFQSWCAVSPGVSVVDRGYRNSGTLNTIFMRGINVDGAAFGDYAVSTVSPVSAYVNDTPMFANFLLRDLNRVEVLRGPQGTLYGSGSLGGTLRYITNAPKLGEFAGSARVGGAHAKGSGSSGWDADVMLNLPIGERMAVRIVGSEIDYPGIVDLPNAYVIDETGAPAAPGGDVLSTDPVFHRIKDADTVEIGFVRASVLWHPVDSLDLTLTHVRQSDDIGGPAPGHHRAGWLRAHVREIRAGVHTARTELARSGVDLARGHRRSRFRHSQLVVVLLRSSRRQHQREQRLLRTCRLLALLSQHAATDGGGFAHLRRPGLHPGDPSRQQCRRPPLRLRSGPVLSEAESDRDPGQLPAGLLSLVPVPISSATPSWSRTCIPTSRIFTTGAMRISRIVRYSVKALGTRPTRSDLTLGMRYFENKDVNNTEQFVTPYRSLRRSTLLRSRQGQPRTFRGNIAWRFATDHLLYGTVSRGLSTGGRERGAYRWRRRLR